MKLRTRITVSLTALLAAALTISFWKSITVYRETLQEYAISDTVTRSESLISQVSHIFNNCVVDKGTDLSLTDWSMLHYKFSQLATSYDKSDEYVVQIEDNMIYNNSGVNVRRALLQANPKLADFEKDKHLSEREESDLFSCILSLSGNDYCIAGKMIYVQDKIYTVAYAANITELIDLVRQMTAQYIQIGLVVIMLTTILMIRILYYVLRPIKTLQKKAADIAGGDYQARIDLSGKMMQKSRKGKHKNEKIQQSNRKAQPGNRKAWLGNRKAWQKNKKAQPNDELTALSLSFNEMADAVELHINEVEAQSEQRRMLLSALSHEMKTPVTSITGYSYMLLHSKLTEEQQKEALFYIDAECRRLERLSGKLNQLVSMDYAQISMQEIGADQLAEAVKRALTPTAEKHQISMQVKAEETAVFTGDPDLLTMLITNLFDNARKAGSKIIIITLEKDRISVRDNGTGIPEDKLDKVMQPFYQGDESRNTEGFGLGLALCQKIAAAHGAVLEIRSEYGVGTQAVVLFTD